MTRFHASRALAFILTVSSIARAASTILEVEPNDRRDQAMVLPPDGSELRASVSDASDVDWFLTSVPDRSILGFTLRVEVVEGEQVPIVVDIFPEGREEPYRSYRDRGGHFDRALLPAGQHALRIRMDESQPIGPYRLRLTVLPLPAPSADRDEVEPNDVPEEAEATLSPGETVAGIRSGEADEDWFILAAEPHDLISLEIDVFVPDSATARAQDPAGQELPVFAPRGLRFIPVGPLGHPRVGIRGGEYPYVLSYLRRGTAGAYCRTPGASPEAACGRLRYGQSALRGVGHCTDCWLFFRGIAGDPVKVYYGSERGASADREIELLDPARLVIASGWTRTDRPSIEAVLPFAGKHYIRVKSEETFLILIEGPRDESRSIVRGDADGDHRVDIGDAISILNALFAAGPAGPCLAAQDADGDAALGVGDAIRLLTYLFSSGPSPVEPFPGCGPLRTITDLDCERSTCP